MPLHPPLEHDWRVKINPDSDALQTLRQRLIDFNKRQSDIDFGQTLAVFLHDTQGELIGGISGTLWGSCLEIDYLWLDESLRGQGTGKRLVSRLEEAAVIRGGRTALLDTFSFQSPGFYQKLGYETFGIVEGFGDGHHKFFLRKQLMTAPVQP